MKTSLLCALLATAGMMGAMSSAQAQSIDVSVIGTIKPAACVPTLAGGGVIDYGDIPASTLSQTAFNVLPEKTLPISIQCDAPVKVAFRAVDNRASSRVPGATQAIHPLMTNVYNHGLGTVSGANVGGYVMSFKETGFTGDGMPLDNLVSSDGGNNWGTPGVGLDATVSNDGLHLYSWGTNHTMVPEAFQSVAGMFSVQAVLNRGSALPLANDVPLDGSATLEMVYL